MGFFDSMQGFLNKAVPMNTQKRALTLPKNNLQPSVTPQMSTVAANNAAAPAQKAALYPTPTGAPIPKAALTPPATTTNPAGANNPMLRGPAPVDTTPKPVVPPQNQPQSAFSSDQVNNFKTQLDALAGQVKGYADQQAAQPSAYQQATNKVAELQGLSPEQQDLMGQQSALESAYKTGIQTTEEQPIQLDAVLGQKRNIENRYNIQNQTLSQKLANQQAIRSGQLDAAKTVQGANKPESVAAGASLYNPASGKVEYTAPNAPAKKEGFTLGQGDLRFDETGKQIAAGAPKPVSTGTGGLTPYQQFQGAQSLASGLDRKTAAAREITNYGSIINSAYNRFASGDAGDLNATSQAIINSFSKILDPSSVVRETEYARSGAGQSMLQRIEGIGTRLSQGGAGLTAEGLKEFVDLSNVFVKNAQASIEQERQRAMNLAQKFGVSTDFVGGGYQAPQDTGAGGSEISQMSDADLMAIANQ